MINNQQNNYKQSGTQNADQMDKQSHGLAECEWLIIC